MPEILRRVFACDGEISPKRAYLANDAQRDVCTSAMLNGLSACVVGAISTHVLIAPIDAREIFAHLSRNEYDAIFVKP